MILIKMLSNYHQLKVHIKMYLQLYIDIFNESPCFTTIKKCFFFHVTCHRNLYQISSTKLGVTLGVANYDNFSHWKWAWQSFKKLLVTPQKNVTYNFRESRFCGEKLPDRRVISCSTVLCNLLENMQLFLYARCPSTNKWTCWLRSFLVNNPHGIRVIGLKSLPLLYHF